VSKTAYLFPGQGSQSVGMGQDFYQEYDVVREIFDMAEEITRVSLSRLCFKGPLEELTQTIHLQPALTAVNLACLAVLNRENASFDSCAGHSLGEYSALCAAGVISREDTLRLVFKRGQLMHREATRHAGAMHAIIGLSIEDVEDILAEAANTGVVSVANHNTEKQIVITGAPPSVRKAANVAAERGAKAIPLKVSGAWHSELIQGAQDEFKEFLKTAEFRPPQIEIFFNVTADVCNDPGEIKTVMARQFCSPVKWYELVQKLIQDGVDAFVEVGPGKVLAGLLKKTLPADYAGKIYNVGNLKQLELFLKEQS
jgi:[acyl-carrier-protein] S-malonyltransferase